MLARFARITAELAAPTPSKPSVGVALFNTVRSLQQLEKDNKKLYFSELDFGLNTSISEELCKDKKLCDEIVQIF